MRLVSAFACLTLAAALPGQGTFFVDAAGGSDSNSGTLPTQAWKSLTKACLTATKGSTVLVLPGTYSPTKTGEIYPATLGASLDQSNIQLIALGGPSQTFVDGDGTYAGIGMLRVRNASSTKGVRISGFTFQNMGPEFWACAIRLGSTSGGTFMAVEAEVDNCVFQGLCVVVFGASENITPQSTGNKIHDNLFLGPKAAAIALYGDGVNYAYHNTIVGPQADGVFCDSIVAAQPSKAVVLNNLVTGGKTNGIRVGANGGPATVRYNCAFGNLVNWAGFTPDATNVAVDPGYVDAPNGNYRLLPTSPLVDAGTDQLPLIRHDLDYRPHLFAWKLGGRKPDIGAYELHASSFTVTAPLQVGKVASFRFTGPAGLSLVFWSLSEGALPTPYGVLLLDLATLLPDLTLRGTIPGNLGFPVPNAPELAGLRLVLQGAAIQAGKLELLEVREQVL